MSYEILWDIFDSITKFCCKSAFVRSSVVLCQIFTPKLYKAAILAFEKHANPPWKHAVEADKVALVGIFLDYGLDIDIELPHIHSLLACALVSTSASAGMVKRGYV